MPGASGIVLPNAPHYTIIASTDEFASLAGVPKETLIGSSLFDYFPDNPAAPNVSNDIRNSLQKCVVEKKKNQIAVQRYDIVQPDGSFLVMYWTVVHTPILDDAGEILYIIHTANDVTHRIQSDKKDERIKSVESMHSLFMQSAVAIHIFKGPELIVGFANEPSLLLWGQDKSIIGKPLREVIPELIDQGFHHLLLEVLLTGKLHQATEALYVINRNGADEHLYLNFVLQPYFETGGTYATGVIAIISDVTALHADRRLLSEKEKSLELAVEIGGLGVFSIDLRDNMVRFSSQIREWLGVADTILPLNEMLKTVHLDDYSLLLNAFTEISDSRENRRHNITFRVTNPGTGQLHYLRSIGQLHDEDGGSPILTGIIQDITTTVKSSIALEQSAHRLKNFIDGAPFPIGVYVGKEMRIEMVNQAILDAWGRDASVVGLTFAEALPELKVQNIYEQLENVFTTGIPFHTKNRAVDLEVGGKLQTFYFNYSFTPLFDTDGSVYGVMNTAADVTDLNVAQMALRESERNFRTMILQSPVAMCLLRGPQHIVEVANDAMIKIWGKDTEQVMQRPLFSGLPDARNQGIENLLATVYQTGETFKANEMAVNLIRAGKNELVYVNFVYEPYRDGNGNIWGIMAIAIDVTAEVLARHQIEQVVKDRTRELEQTNESLKKSNAELEQFAYIASHDLQEPLRKITMFTGLLHASIADPGEQAKRHMEKIEASAQRMSKLVADILSYSQLSRKNDAFVATNLSEIYDDVAADFDFLLEEKNAKIKVLNLPTIEAIPLQMAQLFHNLISNSLKYSRADAAPEIQISGGSVSKEHALSLGLQGPAETYCSISFKDNGIGFSPLYAEKIFSIFQRLHGRGQYEGTGIGLAMCRKIAENHGGIIFANAREGLGAEFVVILPKQQY